MPELALELVQGLGLRLGAGIGMKARAGSRVGVRNRFRVPTITSYPEGRPKLHTHMQITIDTHIYKRTHTH